MNFDEPSDPEGDTEEERPRSLSPNTDTTRPSSAASGKDVPVSSTEYWPAIKLESSTT